MASADSGQLVRVPSSENLDEVASARLLGTNTMAIFDDDATKYPTVQDRFPNYTELELRKVVWQMYASPVKVCESTRIDGLSKRIRLIFVPLLLLRLVSLFRKCYV